MPACCRQSWARKAVCIQSVSQSGKQAGRRQAGGRQAATKRAPGAIPAALGLALYPGPRHQPAAAPGPRGQRRPLHASSCALPPRSCCTLLWKWRHGAHLCLHSIRFAQHFLCKALGFCGCLGCTASGTQPFALPHPAPPPARA